MYGHCVGATLRLCKKEDGIKKTQAGYRVTSHMPDPDPSREEREGKMEHKSYTRKHIYTQNAYPSAEALLIHRSRLTTRLIRLASQMFLLPPKRAEAPEVPVPQHLPFHVTLFISAATSKTEPLGVP